MGASMTIRAGDEVRRAQAFMERAAMHRGAKRFERARHCYDSARYHMGQAGALLGLNPWPR
jgi:hypothetical protein